MRALEVKEGKGDFLTTFLSEGDEVEGGQGSQSRVGDAWSSSLVSCSGSDR